MDINDMMANYVAEDRANFVNVVSEIKQLLPLFAQYIHQFNHTLAEHSIYVVSDSAGNLSIDVSDDMPKKEIQALTKRIRILDDIITKHNENLSELFRKGTNTEIGLQIQDPNYVSKLTDKITEFKRLNDIYNMQVFREN
jgi:hypothetical protein